MRRLSTSGVTPTFLMWPAILCVVLEKIYYKNAMRIYPRVREQMKMLGYAGASAAEDN